MKITNAMILTGVVTIIAIIIANVAATEYRIRRERKEKLKAIETNGLVCPPCAVCENHSAAT